MRCLLVIGCAVALAAAAAGCGGGGGGGATTSAGAGTTTAPRSAADWANGFCSAIGMWGQSIATAGTSVTSEPSKDGLQSFLDKMQSANEKLKGDLNALGTPPSPGADQAKEAGETLADTLQTNIGKLQDAFKDVTTAQQALAALPTLTATLSAMGTDLRSAGEQLKAINSDDAWKKAFSESSACQALNRG